MMRLTPTELEATRHEIYARGIDEPWRSLLLRVFEEHAQFESQISSQAETIARLEREDATSRRYLQASQRRNELLVQDKAEQAETIRRLREFVQVAMMALCALEGHCLASTQRGEGETWLLVALDIRKEIDKLLPLADEALAEPSTKPGGGE